VSDGTFILSSLLILYAPISKESVRRQMTASEPQVAHLGWQSNLSSFLYLIKAIHIQKRHDKKIYILPWTLPACKQSAKSIMISVSYAAIIELTATCRLLRHLLIVLIRVTCGQWRQRASSTELTISSSAANAPVPTSPHARVFT